MATMTAAETGHASTLLNTVRQAGGAAGVALLGTVVAATGAGAADLAGYRLAFLAAAGLMAAGLVFCFFVDDAAAGPTMAGRAGGAVAALQEAALRLCGKRRKPGNVAPCVACPRGYC